MSTNAGKKAKPKAKPKRRICRVPGCTKPGRARDVCGTHHNGFWRQVKAGEITWDELEAAGLVGPGREQSNCRQLVAAVKAKRTANSPTK